MKALVVIDKSGSDVSFYSVDKEFEAFLLKRSRELASDESRPEELINFEAEFDVRTALSTFLLAFSTSLNVLGAIKKPLVSIQGENGFVMAFHKFDGCVYIALSGDGQESDGVLIKKLFLFNKLLHFLYGPLLERMSPSNVVQKQLEWRRLSGLLATYEQHYNDNPMFLLQAVERVYFDQLQSTAENCFKLVEECLESSRNGGLQRVQQVFLLVGTKLLSTREKSARIKPTDVLMIILYVAHHYWGVEPSGPQVVSTPTSGSGGQKSEAPTPPFQTPRSTPAQTMQSQQPLQSTDQQTFSGDLDMDDPDQYKTPTGMMDTPDDVPPTSDPSVTTGPQPIGLPINPPSDIPAAVQSKYMEELVFLQPKPSEPSYLPYMLHCMELHPGIVLVIVSECLSQDIALAICEALSLLSSTFSSMATCSSHSTVSTLNGMLRKISSFLKTEVQAVSSSQLRRTGADVQRCWGNLRQLWQQALPCGDTMDDRTFTRLESQSETLMDNLHQLFERLYFSPRQREHDSKQVERKLIKNFQTFNSDFCEYITMKGTYNISMASFAQYLPGMVHFVLIDRSFGEMITPSIHNELGLSYVEKVAAEEGQSCGVFLRKKVWDMVHRVHKYLALGYYPQSWQDQHFVYSYYLWINIPSALEAPQQFRYPTMVNKDSESSSVPGVIGSSFFQNFKDSEGTEGYVYELYCIHQRGTSLKCASKGCRDLIKILWPNMREFVAPFGLIA
ncbi:hypothetical protein EMCRGX_G029497 [Ephydatia muelleri]